VFQGWFDLWFQIALGTFAFVSLIIALVMPHIPAFSSYTSLCRSQASLLLGAMSIERSASSALAVISETKAKGVMTKTTLGITVASDVVLLVFFAFTSTFAEAACTSAGFNVETFLSLVVSVLICIIGGFVLGEILIFYLWIPGIPSQARGVLILPTGYLVFYFADWVLEHSKSITGMQINVSSLIDVGFSFSYLYQMEPLLMCMIASCLAGNESKNRRKFANILHKSAPYIFVPFFTLTGASLNLKAVASSLGLAAILVAIRASVIFGSTFVAGKYVLKQPKEEYRLLWLTLLPQAGTLLGLVNELQTYGDWATPICSAAVAALIVNNVVGLKLLYAPF
jgi:Kef-type K+ transport system membrane component KefB